MAFAAVAGCFDSDRFESGESLTEEQRETLERVEGLLARAEVLAERGGMSSPARDRLGATVREAQAALSELRAVRGKGRRRAQIMGGIGATTAVLAGDDASGVGVLDDPLLLGCGVAAMVTLIATERRASRGEHDAAWGRLQSRLDALRGAVDAVTPTSSAGAGECAEPSAPADVDVDAEGEAGERETADVAPVPAERRRYSCATSMPDELACSALPFEYMYSSRQAALIEIKTRTGENGLRLHGGRARAFGGPCPKRGSHYNVRAGSRRVGSIACCPCCLDTSRGPNRTERCRIIW
jgi:hypothetical protein